MSPGAKRHRAVVVACVALPISGLLFGIARSELHLARSQEWVLAVRGYDPRDLLRGRYIAYSLDLKEEPSSEPCRDKDPGCCLCLTRISGQELPRVIRYRCDTAKSCDGMLRTDSLWTLRRYYVPEAQAAAAEERLRAAAQKDSARIVIAIDPSGKSQVKAMLVDGGSLVR